MAAVSRSTPTNPRSHPAFRISVALGVLGCVTILVAIIAGADTIFEVGTVIGAMSLISAMAWRADLVASWRQSHPKT